MSVLDDEALTGRRQRPGRKLDSHPGRCAHTYPDGGRCPMAGTLSAGILGGDRWLCRWHDAGVKLGRDWPDERRILAEEARNPTLDPLRAEMERRVAAHPEWRRQPGEGRSAYRARMMALHVRLNTGDTP